MGILKSITRISITVLLGLALSACGSSATSGVGTSGGSGSGSGGGSTGGTIKIGVPGPINGSEAKMGQDIVNAAKLAVNQINDAGGVLGKKLEVVSIDDSCDAQVSTQAANKLMTSGVVAVVGHYCSSAAIPASAIYNDNNIPSFYPASSNPKLTQQGFNTVFRMIGRDDQQGGYVADYLVNKQKKQNIAILHDNSTYAKGLADEAKANIEKSGGKVVFFDAITKGEKDFSVTLSKIKTLHPDAIYWTGYYAEGGLLIKQAKDLGINALFMAGDANNDTTLMSIAGPAAEGVLVDTTPTAQFLSGAQDFISAYQKAYNTDPGPYSVFEYDGVKMVAEAIKKANSTDGKTLSKTIHDMKDFQGASGNVAFDDKGDRTQVLYITLAVKDGKFVKNDQ